jgi:hypothetical protein
MKRFIRLNVRSLCRFFLTAALGGILVLSGFGIGFGMNTQPSYAETSTPKQALQEIKRDQAAENPAATYEEMKQITEDPKTGIEKEYEKNEQEYFQEHPEQGGLVEQAKTLVTKVKGTDEK